MFVQVFIKGKDDIPSTNLGKRNFVNITAFILNIMVFIFACLLGTNWSGISILSAVGLFNEYIFLLLFGVLVFFHFQSNSSIAMLLKNLFCDFEESNDSIKGQLQAIFNTKRFVMGLCLIALIFMPNALFIILSNVISDSKGFNRRSASKPTTLLRTSSSNPFSKGNGGTNG
mgnify:CR=1 FL=1